MNILITGSSGFIGNAIVNYLSQNKSLRIFCGNRCNNTLVKGQNLIPINLGDFSEGKVIWPKNFKIDIIIHTVAQQNENINKDKLNKINTEATKDLAIKASKFGVKRFIFLSSIKVYGEKNKIDLGLTELMSTKPESFYSKSKLNAENHLKKIVNQKKINMDYVIVRLPLVYGPGVKGNFKSLIKLVQKSKFPLPFGNSGNKRSFIAIDNVVDFINYLINLKQRKKTRNQIFCISDDEIISTTILIKRIIKVFNFKINLFPMPRMIVIFLAKLILVQRSIESIYGNLYFDISKVKKELNWKPVIDMNDQLKKIKYDKNY